MFTLILALQLPRGQVLRVPGHQLPRAVERGEPEAPGGVYDEGSGSRDRWGTGGGS